jgi:hypothetical protein
MEYMTINEVRANAEEIRAWFETLMAKSNLAIKKGSRQWQFFRHCLNYTLGDSTTQSYQWSGHKIVHHKFEVENKLRGIYTSSGPPLPFVFRIVSERDARRLQIISDDDYPIVYG